MGVIADGIKYAADKLYKEGDVVTAAKKVAHVGDYSVRSQDHAGIMYDAIREHFKKPVFECVFYDGENGVYHLLDFDPNGLSKEELLEEVKSRLQHQCNVDPCDVDRFMESVYLIDSNMMIKVVED
jgi:hypothetical protein